MVSWLCACLVVRPPPPGQPVNARSASVRAWVHARCGGCGGPPAGSRGKLWCQHSACSTRRLRRGLGGKALARTRSFLRLRLAASASALHVSIARQSERSHILSHAVQAASHCSLTCARLRSEACAACDVCRSAIHPRLVLCDYTAADIARTAISVASARRRAARGAAAASTPCWHSARPV